MRSGPADTDPLVLDKIKKAFQDIGYEVTHQVVEATEFGVPQKRKRILLVGWQPEHTDFDTASFWADVNAVATAATTMRTFVTPCMDGAFEIPPANVPDDFADYALPIPQSAVPTGTPHPYVVLKASATNEEYGGVTYKSLLTCSKRGSPIHSEIIDVDKPCKTIICTYDHQPRLLVGLRKPDGTAYCRALLPDELKQIQGFPATYKIHGTTKEQVTQIGNAVPPPIIEAVAAALKLRLI
jgi:DNA (cytosine-5)-methyltransferase 1